MIAPGGVDPVQDRGEALALLGVAGGEIGGAEEGAAVRAQEHRHRPAPAAAREGLQGGHVDLVDVGSLLAVDLYADELLVEDLGDRPVPEALALHDVAPVAGTNSRWKERSACPPSSPSQTPRPPTDTSRRGCGRAAGGRGSSPSPGGSAGLLASSPCRDRRGDPRGRRTGRGGPSSIVCRTRGSISSVRLLGLAPGAARGGVCTTNGPGLAPGRVSFSSFVRAGGGLGTNGGWGAGVGG